MKREELKAKGLTDEQIDFVMAENGKDVEGQKSKLTTIEAERDGLKKQLTDANAQIEGFKGMDIEGVKKSADEWKAKAEQAQTDAAAQLSALRFDHALDGALTGAKAKNAKAVKALLDSGALKLNEADGTIVGLKDQLEKIKSENDYLFEGEVADPKIVGHSENKSLGNMSAFEIAAMKGAGISLEGK